VPYRSHSSDHNHRQSERASEHRAAPKGKESSQGNNRSTGTLHGIFIGAINHFHGWRRGFIGTSTSDMDFIFFDIAAQVRLHDEVCQYEKIHAEAWIQTKFPADKSSPDYQNAKSWSCFGTEVGFAVLDPMNRLLPGSLVNRVNSAQPISKILQSAKTASFTYSKTAGAHLNEIVKRGIHAGRLERPYMRSSLVIQEIIKTGRGLPDASAKGALNFKVPGTFRKSEGTWELVIDLENNHIFHFNFVSN